MKFPVLVPAVLGTEHISKIAVIKKELVDIQFPNGIRYRTSKGTGDISGDYRKYDHDNKFDVSGSANYHVTAKGFYGKFFLAIWTDDTYCYSIHMPHGVSLDSLKELIKSLTQVNGCETMDNVALPNPMVEYGYIFEAEYAAGFGVPVPTVLGTDRIEHIFVISGKVVELDYKYGIVYRIARGDEDISGIYETYSHVEAFGEGVFRVTAKGDLDLYYVSVWKGCGMTWSLYCPHGIHKKSLIALINSLRLTDSCDSASDKGLSENGALGDYTAYHVVTDKETAIFHEAMNLVGVDYEPLLAAEQLVAGRNYRFICNAKVVALNASPYLAQVTVFVPLSSGKSVKPVITDIKHLD